MGWGICGAVGVEKKIRGHCDGVVACFDVSDDVAAATVEHSRCSGWWRVASGAG